MGNGGDFPIGAAPRAHSVSEVTVKGFPNRPYNQLRSFANIREMYDEIVIVTGNRPLSGSHFLLSVESPRQAQATRPGQFAMLRILGRSDVLLRRPMSIYDLKAKNSEGENDRKSVLPASFNSSTRLWGTGPG